PCDPSHARRRAAASRARAATGAPPTVRAAGCAPGAPPLARRRPHPATRGGCAAAPLCQRVRLRRMIVASRRSLRRLRVAGAATRWLLCAVAVVGWAASARSLVAPPRPIVRTVASAREDHAVQAAAVSFARAYLALDGQRPDGARAALAALTGE